MSSNYPSNRKSRAEDLTGKVYHLLTVLKRNGHNSAKQVLWECACRCGKTTTTSGTYLKKGHTKSCGCLKLTNPSLLKHGLSEHPLYSVWRAMVSRCTFPSNNAYHNCGGRGITVCDRWLGDSGVLNFIEDMGVKPEGMSLERVDNSAGYSPDNCKWENKSNQQFNRRKDVHNTSGRTEVYWRKDRDYWVAQIEVKTNTIRLGTFKLFEDAVKARESAEMKYHGRIKD